MEQKTCTRCKLLFDIDRFPIILSRNGKRSSMHDDCKREYDREHYKKHKKRRREKKNENGKNFNVRRKLFVIGILKKSKCSVCGNNDWRVLEFHHRERETKDFVISDGFKYSLEALKKEIEKCDIVCANCHRILTISQMNYYQYENEFIVNKI